MDDTAICSAEGGATWPKNIRRRAIGQAARPDPGGSGSTDR